MKRRQWLLNDFEPGLVKAHTFDVREGPVQLTAIGLAVGETIPIEVRVDAITTLAVGTDHYWTPLARNGCRYELRADNNQLVVIVPGTYRIVPGARAGLCAVALWEDENLDWNSIKYIDLPHQCESDTPPPCASAPVPEMEFMQVTRCDATTGAPVTLLYGVHKANNEVCPPVAAGPATLLGFFDAEGAYTAGAYPGTLGSCGCSAATPLGEVGTWG